MTASIEQFVRPAGTGALGVTIPGLTRKIVPPVFFIILAGSGVKTFQGEATLSVTVYNKKAPMETSIGSGNPLLDQLNAANASIQNAFTALSAGLNAANAPFKAGWNV
jgi:hypothetical protein